MVDIKMSGGKELVLFTLRQATSQDFKVLKPAEIELRSWETEKGFYPTLMEIFCEHSLEVNVRWLAVLYFKNGIDRYWRKTAPNAISEDEKAVIRSGLLQNLREPVSQIALQLSVLISKIGRVDCPREWPELLPSLFEGLKVLDELGVQRTLLTMHHVIKQLSSKRLPGDRKAFQDLTTNIFTYMLQLWRDQTDKFLQSPVINPESKGCMERSHLCLKILRKLIIYGFKRPQDNQDVVAFLTDIFPKIKSVLEFRKLNEGNDALVGIFEKYSVLLTKILIDLHDQHPFAIVPFIRSSLQLTLHFVFTPEGEDLIFTRLVVQCLNLMKAIMLCAEYKPSKNIKDVNEPETLEAHAIKKEFFTKDVLVCICNKLISHYFLLKQEDLQLWESYPEGFSLEVEGGESWKYSLRPCTESLFSTLFYTNSTVFTESILRLVHATKELVSPNDFNGIVQKDAIYNAAGLCSFQLYDDIDFDQWFTTTLIAELKVKDSNYRILRRRVIWLVGKWTGVKFHVDNRPLLYEACVNLLSAEEDFVVRITAAMTLKTSLEDCEFEVDQFLPFLPTLFVLLFDLLKEAHECDTKMQVLNVISFMIQIVGLSIQPHLGPLVQYLPSLWEESSDSNNMLRAAILSTFVYIVSGLMKESFSLHPFLLRIIRVSTDISTPHYVYLYEDALHLWLTVIENCQTGSEPILDLFQNMIPLLEMTSDNLNLCLKITNAYILLCPQEFLLKYNISLLATLRSLLTDLRGEGLRLVLKCIEMIMRVLPQDSSKILRDIFPQIVISIQNNPTPMDLSMYLSLLARLVLYSEECFTWVIAKVSEQLNKPIEDILDKLLKTWSDKMSLISPEERKKLCALGLAHLCGMNWPPVLKVWPLAVTAIGEVVFDLTMEDSNEDKLVVSNGDYSSSSDEYEMQTEHSIRIQNLVKQDPVHTTALRSYLAQRLRHLVNTEGNVTVEELVQHLEVDCKKLLSDISMSA